MKQVEHATKKVAEEMRAAVRSVLDAPIRLSSNDEIFFIDYLFKKTIPAVPFTDPALIQAFSYMRQTALMHHFLSFSTLAAFLVQKKEADRSFVKAYATADIVEKIEMEEKLRQAGSMLRIFDPKLIAETLSFPPDHQAGNIPAGYTGPSATVMDERPKKQKRKNRAAAIGFE